jgi:hypothetical protein
MVPGMVPEVALFNANVDTRHSDGWLNSLVDMSHGRKLIMSWMVFQKNATVSRLLPRKWQLVIGAPLFIDNKM